MFFDIFCALCAKQGISPNKAAGEIGLSNSITTKWKKTGATPGGETLNKIAQYFGVSTDSLLGKENMPAPTGEQDPVSQVDMAFYGDYQELSEDDKETIRDMVRIMRQRRSKKEE